MFEQLASKGRNYVNSIRMSKTDSLIKHMAKETAEGTTESPDEASMTKQGTDSQSNEEALPKDQKVVTVGQGKPDVGEEDGYPPEWYHQQKLASATNESKLIKNGHNNGHDPGKASGCVTPRASIDGPAIVDLSGGRLLGEKTAKISYAKMWSPGGVHLPQNNLSAEKTEMLKRYLGDLAEYEQDRDGAERRKSAPENGFRAGSAAIEHEKDRKRMKASGVLRAAGLSFDPFSASQGKVASVSAGAGREPTTYNKKPHVSKRSRAIYGKKDLYHRTLKETLNDPTLLRAKAEFIHPSQPPHDQDFPPTHFIDDSHESVQNRTGFCGPDDVSKEQSSPGVLNFFILFWVCCDRMKCAMFTVIVQ